MTLGCSFFFVFFAVVSDTTRGRISKLYVRYRHYGRVKVDRSFGGFNIFTFI